MTKEKSEAMSRIAAWVQKIKPGKGATESAGERLRLHSCYLRLHPEEAHQLGADLRAVLSEPFQAAFYAETGVRSEFGFWLEVRQRLGERLLPNPPGEGQLRDVLGRIFPDGDESIWLGSLSWADWAEFLAQIWHEPTAESLAAVRLNLAEAIRMLSYRLAGAGLDRELLRADWELERHQSPFLAQNALLIPLLDAMAAGEPPDVTALAEVDVLLDQCRDALDRVRRRAGEVGISIRLTYVLARLRQLKARLRRLLKVLVGGDHGQEAIALLLELVAAEHQRHHLRSFVGENISLLARNVTDHASRHGEHYIAENRSAWLAMARSAAGGGIIIACMALIKVRLSLWHLPPLTEGIALGLNYGLGFALIHLLGFVVATKQPAMTAAAMAATLEEARPKELGRLTDLVENLLRTQFIAVLGNVCLAVPVAFLLAWGWGYVYGQPPAPEAKLLSLLSSVHPWQTGALFFAAVAGVGLFLSGLVSGYFDNQARYHHLARRIEASPTLQRLGHQRARRLGLYLDQHYGAILGNLFFGLYLGLMGAVAGMTGLPVDIRHVAFSSANLGTVLAALPWESTTEGLKWAVPGLVGIALINLAVSFSLALFVAMKSRRQGAIQILDLSRRLGRRFFERPLSFFLPPRQQAEGKHL